MYLNLNLILFVAIKTYIHEYLKRELKLCREEHIQFHVCAYKGEVICS